jgi:hypothetical protein
MALVTNETDTTITASIKNCARCGEDHADLTFERMERPIDDEYPFWALCPRGKGPILLQSLVG